MKTQTPFTEIGSLEKDLAEIAPLVREGYRQLGGPSARVEEAIREAARKQAARRKARLAWPLARSLAAAAALVLLLGGGALQLHLSREAELQAEAAARRLAAERRAAAGETSAGFANILLEIQGLNEEGFFSHEETESLSL
jgi:anti-sigma factor RsiW